MFASLEPPSPEMQQLMAALVGDPIQTGRFFGTLISTYPAEAFFAPDNLARLMGGPPASDVDAVGSSA